MLPQTYHDEQVAARERELVFEKHWAFVGLTDDLPGDGDSIALPIGRESVLVMNVKGAYRAFRNVCAHRGARLRAHGRGSGPLRCAYHGWTYDGDGIPTGIPHNRDLFGCTDEDRRGLSLPRFRVEAIGRFLFVQVAQQGPDLAEYLGPEVRELLNNLSAISLTEFTGGSEVWASNWKLAVENTLEPYHLSLVHGESLADAISPTGEHKLNGVHSESRHDLLPASRRWWAKVVERGQLSGLIGVCDYSHHFIYPALCLGVTFGTLLSIQQFEPLSPSTTRLTYRLFLASSHDEGVPYRRDIKEYLAAFNRQVLDEDKIPVELCQLGTSHGAQPAWFGVNESRVRAFHHAIVRDLNIVHPEKGLES